MSNWNYRVLAHKGEEVFFQIHEVYYNEEGIPNGYTEKDVGVGSESPEGLSWVLDKMKECIDKPILSADNFPNEYKP